MDDQTTEQIIIPQTFLSTIAVALICLPYGEVYERENRETLAQIVDWREACLTTEQLRRALSILGRREELSPPPQIWNFSDSIRNIPISTILTPIVESEKTDGFSRTVLA